MHHNDAGSMTGGKRKEKYLSKEEPQHRLSTVAPYREDLPTKTSVMTETPSFIIRICNVWAQWDSH